MDDRNVSFFKKHSEIKSFLFSLQQNLSVPHVCYDVFCPDKTDCPSLEHDNVIFDITKFLPDYKMTSIIKLNKIYLDGIRRAGFEGGIALGRPFNVYTNPASNFNTEKLTRVFAKLQMDVLIQIAEKTRIIHNINSVFDIEIPIFFHLDENFKMAGCYVKTHKSLAYVCEQQNLRVWGFKTPTHILKCQPHKDCLLKKPNESGNCSLPYVKSSSNIQIESTFYNNFANKNSFFELCSWCGG